jgi:hypothetical protein
MGIFLNDYTLSGKREDFVIKSTSSALQTKVDEHNDKYGDDKGKRVTLSMLQAVYDRGIGAYKTNPSSVRPNVTGKEQWAFARVNGFLSAVRTGSYKRGKFDTDLLPEGHPLSSKKEEVDKHGAHDQSKHNPKKGGGVAGAAKQVGEAENEMHEVNEKIQGTGETSRTKSQERSADITQESQEEITSAKDSLAAAKRAPSDFMYKENLTNAAAKLKSAGDRLVERGVNDAQASVGKKLRGLSQTLLDDAQFGD